MNINYDTEADSKYIKFDLKSKVAQTKKIQNWLLVDCDKEGNVIGVEVLSSSKHPVAFALDENDKIRYMQVRETDYPQENLFSVSLDTERALELV